MYTMDARFVRPCQPIKGTPIYNIYVREFSYPTTTKLYKFKYCTVNGPGVGQGPSSGPGCQFVLRCGLWFNEAAQPFETFCMYSTLASISVDN
jgi:hypothetical protein